MESFSDYGIVLPTGAYGNARAICPQCTQTRKPQHQKNKDLSVEVEKERGFATTATGRVG